MSYCLICYKNCDNPAQIYNKAEKVKVKIDIKRFFRILQRYINGGKDEGCTSTRFPNEVDKVMEVGILSCHNCYNLLENFCDIYYILEETEMILNWKLKCLAEIMECVASNNLLKGRNALNFGSGRKEITEWRRMIVAKCNKKIQSSFPKLILKRSFAGKTCLEMPKSHNDPDETLEMGVKPSDNIDPICDNNGNLIDLIEDTNTANIKNELAYPPHEEEYTDGPAQPLSDESNFSDNNLENIIPTDDENSKQTAARTIESVQQLNLANSTPLVSAKETEVAAYTSRSLRSLQSCPKCSKTFSTTQKLQAHLTSHLNDKEILQRNEIIDDTQERDCDEYNPDDLSVYVSESSSSDSESEMDFGNSNVEVISPSNEEIFQAKHQTSERIKNLKQPNNVADCNDLRNVKKEAEDSMPPTNLQIDEVLHDLRRKYKADSDIVDFLTFPCQIEGCSKISFSSRDFEDHQSHHGTFNCIFCSNSFDYAPDLARHELSEHCKGRKKCIRAGCDFKRKDIYIYIHHVLTHHLKLKHTVRSRKFNCKICKTGFGGIERLRRHFKLCRVAKPSYNPVKCDVKGCTRMFKTRGRLNIHKKIMHFTGTKPVCPICNRTFKNRKYLNDHIRMSHQKDLTFPCFVEGCKAKFISQISLDYHVTSQHKIEKDKISHLCPHCGKIFVGSYPFQEHLKSHERPKSKRHSRHICEKCGKVFRQKEALNLHKLSHSGPESWQYQCEICAKKCLTKAKLDEHKRTHGNEKPFVCDICGAKYAHRHNLRIHVNNKHGSVAQDVARHFDKSNLSSRKGAKRRKIEEKAEDTPSSSDPDS